MSLYHDWNEAEDIWEKGCDHLTLAFIIITCIKAELIFAGSFNIVILHLFWNDAMILMKFC